VNWEARVQNVKDENLASSKTYASLGQSGLNYGNDTPKAK
jgi:hypothetical protein